MLRLEVPAVLAQALAHQAREQGVRARALGGVRGAHADGAAGEDRARGGQRHNDWRGISQRRESFGYEECELRFARALDRRACAYLLVPTVIAAGHVKAVPPRGGKRAIGRAAGAPPPRNVPRRRCGG